MIAKKRAEKPEVRKASREAALREVSFVGLNLAQSCVAFAVVIVAKLELLSWSYCRQVQFLERDGM